MDRLHLITGEIIYEPSNLKRVWVAPRVESDREEKNQRLKKKEISAVN
jgi:hypothetical protein